MYHRMWFVKYRYPVRYCTRYRYAQEGLKYYEFGIISY